MQKNIEALLELSTNRLDFWVNFISKNKLTHIAELGVYKGEFAEKILRECTQVEKYLMIDPWRHLSNWNKPANQEDSIFNAFYDETLKRTDFAKSKRVVLRGKTTEVINDINSNSLDFAYIDGDHTLKGISIDLINIWPKIKSGSFIGGDDFSETIWQHKTVFEPTLVFPYAIYFAEAMNTKIYGLPYKQFLITKECNGFEFIDLTKGIYKNTSLLNQYKNKSASTNQKGIKLKLISNFPEVYNLYRKIVK